MKDYYCVHKDIFKFRELWWNSAVAVDVRAGSEVKSREAGKCSFLLIGKSAFTVAACQGASASGF